MSDASSNPSVAKKDKQKVIGEGFDQDKLSPFLNQSPIDGENKDFYILLRAYRGLPLEAFKDFLALCKDNQIDIQAKSQAGKTILDICKENTAHQGYTEILQSYF